jgi:hypothetical protein
MARSRAFFFNVEFKILCFCDTYALGDSKGSKNVISKDIQNLKVGADCISPYRLAVRGFLIGAWLISDSFARGRLGLMQSAPTKILLAFRYL